MKRIVMFLMAICLMASGVTYADTPLEKAQKKEVKNKMKEYNKNGYKIFGSTHTLEVALLKHYDKINKIGESAREYSGVATKCKSKNVGQQMALNNACIDYARQCGNTLRGRTASDLSGNGDGSDAEFDHFYAAYEASVEKEIRGELQHTFSVIKENGDGTYEIQSYFVVDEDAASLARVRALNNAMNETKLAQANAEKIAEFVRERQE